MLELCLHFRVDLFPLMMERDITLPSAIPVSVVNVVADQFLLWWRSLMMSCRWLFLLKWWLHFMMNGIYLIWVGVMSTSRLYHLFLMLCAVCILISSYLTWLYCIMPWTNFFSRHYPDVISNLTSARLNEANFLITMFMVLIPFQKEAPTVWAYIPREYNSNKDLLISFIPLFLSFVFPSSDSW